jgi:hypothetical protein
VIAAIDWTVQHAHDPGLNIRVLNLSLVVRKQLVRQLLVRQLLVGRLVVRQQLVGQLLVRQQLVGCVVELRPGR